MDLTRVAGAPISWGVSEVPGWGHQLTPERVLAEMRGLGLTAAEFGPDGFLSPEPAAALREYGLRPVGGFVPVVLHGPDPMRVVRPAIEAFAAAGAEVLVLAADGGTTGYDQRPELDPAAWDRLLSTVDSIATAAASAGLAAVLHPHVGTVVERAAEVRRVLDGCGIGLCLDTGHLAIGGTDPAELAAEVPDRIGHVHLKDVAAGLARRVADGTAGYTAMVAAGMYRPLGTGDVDVIGIVSTLQRAGYAGWYVLEQDTVLAADPPPGAGPVTDVRTSLDFLLEVAGD